MHARVRSSPQHKRGKRGRETQPVCCVLHQTLHDPSAVIDNRSSRSTHQYTSMIMIETKVGVFTRGSPRRVFILSRRLSSSSRRAQIPRFPHQNFFPRIRPPVTEVCQYSSSLTTSKYELCCHTQDSSNFQPFDSCERRPLSSRSVNLTREERYKYHPTNLPTPARSSYITLEVGQK